MKKKVEEIRRELRNVYWGIYGKVLNNPPVPDNPSSLLFVCKGNICRSPFAERVALRIAKNSSYKNLSFYSAGLEVFSPLTPPENAILAAEKFGVTLHDHKSRKIDQKMIHAADMILAMEPSHLTSLIRYFPSTATMEEKFFLLSLFEGKEAGLKESFVRYHILDPYGQSVDQFHLCYRRIEKCVTRLLQYYKAQDGNCVESIQK